MFSKKKTTIIILFLPILAYILFEIIFINSAYPNIKLGTINVGGKNRAELKKLLQDEFNNRQNRTLNFTLDKSKPISITLNKNIIDLS